MILMSFKWPSDIIMCDMIKDNGLKPIRIQFRNTYERLSFCMQYFNIKRMYHEEYTRNLLFQEFQQDIRDAAITWFVSEVSRLKRELRLVVY